jgi:hypothetical protein
VDGLELEVGQSAPYEQRDAEIVMQERLKVIECVLEQINRRRHEERVGRIRTSEPVLATAELAGCRLLAAHTGKQLGMHLSDQSLAQRQ